MMKLGDFISVFKLGDSPANDVPAAMAGMNGKPVRVGRGVKDKASQMMGHMTPQMFRMMAPGPGNTGSGRY